VVLRVLRHREWPGGWGVPGAGGLDVWLLQVPERPADVSTGMLDAAERRRAAAFARERDRVRYIVAHRMVRRVLAAYLQVAPERVAVVREPCPGCGGGHGRPVLAGERPPLRFSLSHSGDRVMLGVAADIVGVDVEELPAADVVGELVAVLHPAEREEVRGVEAALRPAVFARLWTRKEAYLKGLGVGLGREPHLDYVGSAPRGRAAPPRGWALLDVPVAAGFAGAAALRTADRLPGAAVRVRLHLLPPA
jgi:4'-phosphopantetheinyl transferase